MNKIKVGLIGVGRAGGGMHCPELEIKKDKFEISALCDIDPEQFAPFAQKYKCRTYTKLEDMLADKDIELFSIATRSTQHVEHALAALKTGRHVFLEKPMATSYEDAMKLKAAAEKSSGKLMIKQNRRFEPAFLKVMEVIKSGLIGEVFEVKLRRNEYARRCDWQSLIACGGGQLNNWGPHILDHAMRFLDSPVAEMLGDLKSVSTVGDVEDHLKIVLKGTNGRLVDLEISGGAILHPEPEFLVLGRKGAISADSSVMKVRYMDPEWKIAEIKPNPGTSKNGVYVKDEIKWINTEIKIPPQNSETMGEIWNYVYETIRNGVEFPIKLEEVLEVLKIISDVKSKSEFTVPKIRL